MSMATDRSVGAERGGVHWMTTAEGYDLFDREARRLMGMSGADFIRRWDAGEFDPDGPDHTKLMRLAMLARLGR